MIEAPVMDIAHGDHEIALMPQQVHDRRRSSNGLRIIVTAA